ncbi:e0cfa646-8cfc-4c48-8464-b3e16a0481c5 [Sclerotinia trifoliorum]|uniref:E0cfa646-8cfc-4c48-8464-b3e16a0481c5 n=1 Tax=Sclerotinia trifoliorum TaxID=28548 RepID=A0A8H2VVU5_9HELO|nr:e0cfa646-8cfc-4c48-8464-b3e16a0481c5 [Sclerotinia trifoliorum]
MRFTPVSVALLSVAGVAIAQPHNHQHRHPARANKVVRENAVVSVTEVMPGPIETVYMLNGKDISLAEVQAGLASGKYVLVGDQVLADAPSATNWFTGSIPPVPTTTPTAETTPAAATTPAVETTPTPAPSSTTKPIAEFIEKFSSSSSKSSSSSSSTSTSTSASKSSTAASKSSTSAVSVPTSSSSSSSGNWDDFPNGEISCSTFPSQYGAIHVDYLGLNGWIGIQSTPGYTTSASSIVTINTMTSGGCVKGAFCSYACPAGYQKSQWPSAQGSTGESIGGLYCNANGKLELSRPSVKQLCTAGSGSVKVENKLGSIVAVCRTDYPGLEAETVPLSTSPGQTYDLTCPDASDYYSWEGLPTSAQYYINPQGTGINEACVWGTQGGNVGNWAPVNAGVGKDASGNTWLSIIPNTPTNTYGTLDFTISIEGDVSGKCSYSSGTYYNNGVVSSTGCTVSVNPGGTATYVFS